MHIPLRTILAVGLLAVATPTAAQVVPGYRHDYDTTEAHYRAYALGAFQSVMSAWVTAVNQGDLQGAIRLYSEYAYVQFHDPMVGREAAPAALAAWLPEVDAIRTGLGDFDASGNMAYASVRVLVDGAAGRKDSNGVMLVVMKKERGGWKIRSQTLVMD